MVFFFFFFFGVFFVFYFIKNSKFALPGVMLMYERTSKIERKKEYRFQIRLCQVDISAFSGHNKVTKMCPNIY